MRQLNWLPFFFVVELFMDFFKKKKGGPSGVVHTGPDQLLQAHGAAFGAAKVKVPTKAEWLSSMESSATFSASRSSSSESLSSGSSSSTPSSTPATARKIPMMPPKKDSSPPIPPKPRGARKPIDIPKSPSPILTRGVLLDTELTFIADLLDAYYHTGRFRDAGDTQRCYLLQKIYYSLNNWLKTKTYTAPSNLSKGASDLFFVVCAKLCEKLSISIAQLPQYLNNLYGRSMSGHGVKKDKKYEKLGVLQYLNEAEANDYKLIFDGRRVKQLPWWVGKIDSRFEGDLGVKAQQCQPVIAESERSPCTFVQQSSEYSNLTIEQSKKFLKDWSGFVMNMDREIFMGPHRFLTDDASVAMAQDHLDFVGKCFFHSSYVSGKPVAFAGSISISHGIVMGISNYSGHYMAGLDHMVSVINAFVMHGQNPSTIQIYTINPKTWQHHLHGTAADILRDHDDYKRYMRLRGELAEREQAESSPKVPPKPKKR